MRLAATSLSTSPESGASGVTASTMIDSGGAGRRIRTERASEYCVQKHIGASLEMLRTSVLDLVVTDAVLARHEDHRGRSDACKIDRIMACAADHFAMRKP